MTARPRHPVADKTKPCLWELTTFSEPTKCSVCKALLWGRISQGYMCGGIGGIGCELSVHSSCITASDPVCTVDKKAALARNQLSKVASIRRTAQRSSLASSSAPSLSQLSNAPFVYDTPSLAQSSNAPSLSQSSRMSTRTTRHESVPPPGGPVLRAAGGSVHTARAPPNPGLQGGRLSASTSGPRAAAPAPGRQAASRVSLRAAPIPAGPDAPRAAAPAPLQYVNAEAMDGMLDSLDTHNEPPPPVPARKETIIYPGLAYPAHTLGSQSPSVTRQASGKRPPPTPPTLGRQAPPEDYINVANFPAAVDPVNGQYRNMGPTSAVSLVHQNGNPASNSIGLSAVGAGEARACFLAYCPCH